MSNCGKGDCNSYLEPDNSLATWERWMKIHQEESKILAACTNRPPVDVLMHLPESHRPEKERKIVLENAHLLTRPSIKGSSMYSKKYRFKQACRCAPVYEAKKTAVDRRKPGIIEHIGVPRYIKENEMGLVGTTQKSKFTKINYDFELYRAKKEEEMFEIIKKIDPYCPKLDELIVKGNRPTPPPKAPPPLPDFTIAFASAPVVPETNTIFAILINNTILIKDVPGQDTTHLYKMKKELWNESCTSWTYYFNVTAKKIGRSKFFLKNLGTATIRYCWKKLKRPIPFIPDDINEQVFFFNKCEDVLSPGQEKNVLFTFVSCKPGIFSEFWEFCPLNVTFLESPGDRLLVNFHADATEKVEIIVAKIERLKHSINMKAVLNIVHVILDDVLTKSTSVQPEKYPYAKYLLEAQMFSLKNPLCYYHQTEVAKVRGYYEEMVPKTEWDLSISTVREAIVERNFEERVKYYDLLKNSYWYLLKHWDEGEPILFRKNRAVYLLLGQLMDKFDYEHDRLFARQSIQEDKTIDKKKIPKNSPATNHTPPTPDSLTKIMFYLYVNEHMKSTIDKCAGVLSSIDLDRWIKFDFCRN